MSASALFFAAGGLLMVAGAWLLLPGHRMSRKSYEAPERPSLAEQLLDPVEPACWRAEQAKKRGR